jgi:hypothetical protein
MWTVDPIWRTVKNKLLNTSCHSHPQLHLCHPPTSLTKIPTFLPKSCGSGLLTHEVRGQISTALWEIITNVLCWVLPELLVNPVEQISFQPGTFFFFSHEIDGNKCYLSKIKFLFLIFMLSLKCLDLELDESAAEFWPWIVLSAEEDLGFLGRPGTIARISRPDSEATRLFTPAIWWSS